MALEDFDWNEEEDGITTTISREAWVGFTLSLASAIVESDQTPAEDRSSERIVERVNDHLEYLISIEDSLLLEDEEAMRRMFRSLVLAYRRAIGGS